MEKLAEKYVLLDSLLFKLITTPEKETALLPIPETCADKKISLNHSNLISYPESNTVPKVLYLKVVIFVNYQGMKSNLYNN